MELECHVCHQKFNRREHLDRHLRRHSGIRPFPCPLCSRSFSRRDTLGRHIATHGAGAEGLHVRVRGASACVPCSQAKLKCNGEAPCARCQSKGRTCTYRYPDRTTEATEPGLAASDGVHQAFTNQNIPEDDTMGLGQMPVNSHQRDPICIPSGEQDMINVPTIGYDFPWMLDYTNIFQDDAPSDQPPLLGLATQFPFSPLGSTPAPADDHGCNPDGLMSARLQEYDLSSTLDTSRASIMDATDEDIIIAENFCHVQVVLERPYQAILECFKHQVDLGSRETSFPSQQAFKSFIQLYYEYFDCQLSFIHPSLLETPDAPWLLVLAVACVGSQYTQLAKKEQYCALLTELLQLSLPLDRGKMRGYDTLVLAQCSLLAIVSFMFTGFKDNVINLQVHRAWLATIARPFLTSRKPKGSLLSQEINHHTSRDHWNLWVRCEMERRLAYCYLVVDSFCFIFMGMPMTVAVKDCQQILPCVDELWRTRNADGWSALLPTLDTQQVHSLRDLFISSESTALAFPASDFTKLCQHLMLFVEERQVLAAIQSWVLNDFRSGDQHESSCPQQSPYSSLDWRYQMLIPSGSSASSLGKGVLDTRDTFFHLLFILRHVPRDTLYRYSGWYASKEDISSAQSYLRTWFQENLTLSRQCVAHAGALIGKIRRSPSMSCYDPFCLLISVLFLWAYERLKPASPLTGPEQQARRASSGSTIVFKIDQAHEDSIRERWIRGDPDVVVHITGVGLLSSAGVPRRLLQEYLRIIKAGVGWPTLRRGLIGCVSETISGVAPITTSPHSDDGA